jgi:hypothetical protein
MRSGGLLSVFSIYDSSHYVITSWTEHYLVHPSRGFHPKKAALAQRIGKRSNIHFKNHMLEQAISPA